MKRFGYTIGNFYFICATVGVSIYAGMLYERYTAPEPCIVNFSTTIDNHPFAYVYQEMVDDTEVTVWYEGTDNEVVQSRRDLMQKLIDYNSGTNAFGTIVKGESFVTSHREYYVPRDCYATDLDSFRGPTLYRK